MLETLLADLDAEGWTISWAFQFAPNHWRMSIIRIEDVGEAQGTYISHCADAPSFAEALEDCFAKRNDAEWEENSPVTFAGASSKSLDLSTLLAGPVNIQRRF